MIALVYIIFLVIYFVVNYFAYLRFKEIAAMKGHENFKCAVWIILFGIVGMLMVVALPDRGSAAQTQLNSKAQTQSALAQDELPEL